MGPAPFHTQITRWFHSRVGLPTEVQLQAWPAIQSGVDVLIAAPTGSGKTLAAFLSCIDSLFRQALARELADHTQVLYVSPLKALSNDVQKNLQKPLAEIGQAALEAGLLMPELRVLVRTGDTSMTERQQPRSRCSSSSPPRKAGGCSGRFARSSSMKSMRWRQISEAHTWRCRWNGWMR
jgi:ATP-dependent Lhr-like helicase